MPGPNSWIDGTGIKYTIDAISKTHSILNTSLSITIVRNGIKGKKPDRIHTLLPFPLSLIYTLVIHHPNWIHE